MDAELGGDVEHAAADADNDLGPDYLCGVRVGITVSEHKADAEHIDADAGDEEVFVMSSIFYQDGNEDGGDCGGEGEGLYGESQY